MLRGREEGGWAFNDGDITNLMAQTELERADIMDWANKKRNYYDAPGDMKKYLETDGKVS